MLVGSGGIVPRKFCIKMVQSGGILSVPKYVIFNLNFHDSKNYLPYQSRLAG